MMPYLQGYAVKPPNRNAIRFISLQRMKQTNNAIKFLMAQYRAIFKNANIAMLAAIAASALAAGQAQAAKPFTNTELGQLTGEEGTIDECQYKSRYKSSVCRTKTMNFET